LQDYSLKIFTSQAP